MEWMPIETAPKDGTEVLVWFDFATVPVVHIAWFRSEEDWHDSGQPSGCFESLEDYVGWWSYTRDSVTQEKLEGITAPTHWTHYRKPA